MATIDPIRDILPVLEQSAAWARACPASTLPLVRWAMPEDGLSRLRQGFERLQSAPEEYRRPLRVAIGGENNAGKSTLINALIGERVASTDFFEFTFCPTVFQFAPERGAALLYHDGRSEPLAVEQVDAKLRQIVESRRQTEVKRVEVRLPAQSLRRYQLADVPGVGADEASERVAAAFNDKVDALLFVLNATLLGQTSLTDSIRRLAGEFAALAVVLNKVDMIGYENAERAVEFVSTQEFGRHLPIFPCAAGAEDDDERKTQWVRDIEQHFFDAVAADELRVKAGAALGKCQRDLAGLGIALQSSYHHGSRVLGYITTAFGCLRQAHEGSLNRVESRVQQWLEREAYADATSRLINDLLKNPPDSDGDFNSRIGQFFSQDATHREGLRLIDLVQRLVQDEWRHAASQLAEVGASTFAPFQLETTALNLRLEDRLRENLAVQQLAIQPVPQAVKAEDVKESMEWGEVIFKGATWLLTGVATVSLAPVAPWMAGAAGVAVGVGYLVSRYRSRINKDASALELGTLARECRMTAGKKLLDAIFPEGLTTAVSAEVEKFRQTWERNFQQRLWRGQGDPPTALREVAEFIARGEEIDAQVARLRRLLGTQGQATEVGKLSPAVARARVLYETPARYLLGDTRRLRADMESLLRLEDTELAIVDRGLSAGELAWLSVVPSQTIIRALIYDIERDTTSRIAFLRQLKELRDGRSGIVAVRAVKLAGQDRTPLERVLVLGSGWGLEVSHSLSLTGLREVTVRLLDDATRERVATEESAKYWSIDLLTEDAMKMEIQTVDL